MKHLLLLLSAFQLLSVSGFAQTPTPTATPLPTIASVENLAAVQMIDWQGNWSAAQPIENWWADNTLRPAIRNMVKLKLQWWWQNATALDANDYATAMTAHGIPVSSADQTTLATKIENMRQAKETALLNVSKTNPQRALTKMQALLARGLPITQATQSAVNAAAGYTPTPTPTATPSATPEPNDGL